jgi:putative oxidoreductase
MRTQDLQTRQLLVGGIGRLLLASIFIGGGLDALKDPDPKVPRVEQAGVPRPRAATQADGLQMLVAGSALAAGVKPRLAAAA